MFEQLCQSRKIKTNHSRAHSSRAAIICLKENESFSYLDLSADQAAKFELTKIKTRWDEGFSNWNSVTEK